ncbi:MAG: BTAD domain-containing putative transcriptional regulator [Gaiellaceae bacterium]
MIEFRLLGPLEGPVEVPGGKPRALLARLLLDAGRVVAVDALIESLWGESPPPSAPKVLQAHVSALRKALGPDAIETRAPGYALRGATSDLARFEALSERARSEGDPAGRAELLGEALDLWRGDPLAEFRREPFAEPAAARLAELRLEALVQRIDAELQLGAHEALVSELTALVASEPLRERLREQLMLALYRSGRQADALRVYREGRATLVKELGIDPGPGLQELERAILRQDPALAAPAAGRSTRRGSIVCVGVAPLGLLAALGREIVVVELAADASSLDEAASRLERLRAGNADVRTAVFTTSDPVTDSLRLATEQEAELLLVVAAPDELLAAVPCDLAVSNGVGELAGGAVLVPFGGARDEWAALELGAWVARAHGVPLRLLGVEASDTQRDASRALAAASLALQRFAGVSAEAVLVPPGAEGVLSQGGAAIVASLPRGELDATRRALLAADIPVLLVHGGLRPGGLAPDRTMTRFSWSLSGGGSA